ncbi:biotin carboxylase N-terminal domain-containing protein [Rhodoferax sp.]|uniref:ATP-binding protein n=1 Tax=Rhodoferax sp. TaxID=50421 RepID=UPI0026361DC4|nr:biotin carboxylase N-terminal domain-containing protein [Rhodoferax sp.]MDD2809584.1 biotin carboxylase N-terminal domain-containing protein [Rhodoferax sp.]MDD4942950.1 biotin carboxylase N-terminal domain-containing protein [Rhodoferax sp.]
MFTKILIANRGEISCRVAATARRMGIQTVAVYSDADAHAKHVAACDESVHIGGSAPKDSYLRWQTIIEAAQATGAQAIHPGYGFLSENADFASACAAAGLVFIGPPAASMQAMGLKAESKRLMEQAGVPLVPGYHGADQDPALLQREADRIGYPVLIKASAGGGGKGMRAVERAQDFLDALASCKREAISSFCHDAVLVEKYVQRPRHIEIQVFGDTLGNYVYLFERDCSVQRRHQKVLEEAPAPGMTPELRARMGAAAVAAARAVGYVGAGTVEFIVEQPQGWEHPEAMTFFFMEMNTRLQVEHPVTEAITGQDLVEWQLRVAAGEPLPCTQEQLRITGHAIEARICAENPDRDFLPATGTLDVYRKPPHAAFQPPVFPPLPLGEGRGEGTPPAHPVRFDDGVRQGDAISPYYDSMVAKLIVHGDTRAQALARLDAALAATHIVGLTTNVQFLRHVVQCDAFAKAHLDTGLIPREAAVLFNQQRVGLALAAAADVAQTLLDERATEMPDPFSKTDGWRALGVAERRFAFEFDGQSAQATLRYLHDGVLHLSVCGKAAEVASGVLSFAATPDGIDLQFVGQRALVQVYRKGEVAHVFTAQGATQIIAVDLLAHAGEAPAEGGRLTAPMPGKVVSFAVQAGDTVQKGQALAVLEAMKMEHAIAAPMDGVVAELLYAPGDQVVEGAELLRLEALS